MTMSANTLLGKLVPILKPQPGVCAICRSWSEGHERCWPCREICRELGLSTGVVLPVALAIKHESLASALWIYKDDRRWDSATAEASLRGLVSDFMPRHERCLARAHHCAAFDIVTYVPSLSGRQGRHSVRDLLASSPWSRARLEDLLIAGNPSVPHRGHAADKFSAVGDCTGYTVLLVDDTWTRGAHALSAVRALRDAGASRVGVAVIGRHFDPTFRSSHLYSDLARTLDFTLDYCAICDPRPVSDPPLPSRAESLSDAG